MTTFKRKMRGWDCILHANSTATKKKKKKKNLDNDGTLTDDDITKIIAKSVFDCNLPDDDPIHAILQAGLNPDTVAAIPVDVVVQSNPNIEIESKEKHCLDNDEKTHIVFPGISTREHEEKLMISSKLGFIECPNTGRRIYLPTCNNGELCVCVRAQIADEDGVAVSQSLVAYMTEAELDALINTGNLPTVTRPCVCCIRHDVELMRFKEFVDERRVGNNQLLYTNVATPASGGFPAHMFGDVQFDRGEPSIILHRCRQLEWIRDASSLAVSYLRFVDPYFRIKCLFPFHVISGQPHNGLIDMQQSLLQRRADGANAGVFFSVPCAFALEHTGGALADRTRVHPFRKNPASDIFASILHRVTKKNAQSKIPQFRTMQKKPETWKWIRSLVRFVTAGLTDSVFTSSRRRRLLACEFNYSLDHCECGSSDCLDHVKAPNDIGLMSWVYLCCVRYITWFASSNAPSLRSYLNEYMNFDALVVYMSKYSWPKSFEKSESQVIQAATDCMRFIHTDVGWNGTGTRLTEIIASYPTESPRAFGIEKQATIAEQRVDSIEEQLRDFVIDSGDPDYIPDDWLSDVMPTGFADTHRSKKTLALSVIKHIWRISFRCEDIDEVEQYFMDWDFMRSVGCGSAGFNLIRLVLTTNDSFSAERRVCVRNFIEQKFPYEFNIMRTFITGWNRNSFIRVGYLNPMAYVAQCVAIRNDKEVQRFGNDTKICSVLICELCWRVACRVKGWESQSSQKSKKRKPAIRLFSPKDTPLIMLCDSCKDEEVTWRDLRGLYIVVKTRRIIFCGGCCQVCVWAPVSKHCFVFPVDVETGMPLCAECKNTWFDPK